MAFFLDLFTPETWEGFREIGGTVTGYRERHRKIAKRVKPGDFFICYLVRLSRWCGILEVESESYYDSSPIHPDLDVFTIRFRVKPVVILNPEEAIPIYDDVVWNALTITKDHIKGTRGWTGFFRGSLNRFEDRDGAFLAELLATQESNRNPYPFTAKDKRQLTRKRKIRTVHRDVEVEVPDDRSGESSFQQEETTPDHRVSIQYQAKVGKIGAQMGFHIWVPRNDKTRVLDLVPTTIHDRFLDQLPLNYDDTTMRTIEHIDVLWLKGRSMARAFEIEHTTAIYSGLLRMADLLALQPNMNIRLHIVARGDKRKKVFREIRRPVFSLLERGPLYEQCSFLPYDSIDSLESAEHLSHMSDTIIEEYEESAEV